MKIVLSSRNSYVYYMNRVYVYNFAGHPISFSFLNKRTPIYFSNSIHLVDTDKYDLKLSDKQFNYLRSINESEVTDEYIEYKGLISLTGKELLKYNCCIFHSVAFAWKDKSWLITAESGTGKTTQYLNWIRLYPNEIKMISGDMPVLEYLNNKIIVHPSPWNGKERLGNNISKELGGIIILKQRSDNKIESADVQFSIKTLFKQFMAIPENSNEIHILSEMIECIIKTVPIWILSNKGDEESTCILRSTIENSIMQE